MERAGPGFDFTARTRVVFGPGSLARLGALVRELGGERVLLVSDAGLAAAGHVARAEDALRAAGCTVTTYAEAPEDPDAPGVARCAEALRAARPDLLVALGGGSAIDTAKGAAMLAACGGRMQDYWGFGKTTAPLLPLVAVPTTAGTGSEVQSYALISDEETHQKMACGAADAAPRVALLDPELTLGLPRTVTSLSGLDALGHALETAVSTRANAFSCMLSREAFRLLAPAFPRVLAEPSDGDARADMLLGATWAGLAIEHSMLGAAHSLANPLSAHHGLAHGLAVALALGPVVRFNAEVPGVAARYASIARAGGVAEAGADGEEALEALHAFLAEALRTAGIAPSPEAHGVTAGELPALAEEAARQWTAQFNPRPVGAAELEGLLRAACAR